MLKIAFFLNGNYFERYEDACLIGSTSNPTSTLHLPIQQPSSEEAIYLYFLVCLHKASEKNSCVSDVILFDSGLELRDS